MDGALFFYPYPSFLCTMHSRSAIVICTWAVLCVLLPTHIRAQQIQGSFEAGVERPGFIILEETIGTEYRILDSVAVDRSGRFRFAKRKYPAGYYRLRAGTSDQLVLVLDPREPQLVLSFGGRPLQEHVSVLRSVENQRLWEYKRASRETQARLAALRDERQRSGSLDPTLSASIDARESAALASKLELQNRLIAQDPKGVFQFFVLAERRLSAAIPGGADSVRAAVAWSNPMLLRSATYPKAIMGYLQTLQEPMMEDFMTASDSLLSWSSADTACWRYTRSFLLRAFVQYGPEMVAQHLVDRYLVGSGSLVPAEADLLELSQDLLRVAVGQKAPEIKLLDPVRGDTTSLYAVLKAHRYTVLFFYSSSCDHCHGQMPGLLSLYKERSASGFQVVGIALDVDVNEFQETLALEGLTWPSYSELNGWGAESAKAFAVKSTPTYVLMDAAGTIVAKPYAHEGLREELEKLLR